jgi:hypothetical protein
VSLHVYIGFDVQDAIKELDLAAYRVRKAQREGLQNIKDEVLRLYRLCTWTWKHKPDFEVDAKAEGDTTIRLDIGTDDDVFRWVDWGTRVGKGKYPIRPRHAKALRFMSGYSAKTIPEVFGSKQGGSFGDVVHRRVVMHPGIKPRHFTKNIFKLMMKEGRSIMEYAMKKVAGWR